MFGANLAYRGQTLNGEGMLVSGSYFPVLGAAAGARAACSTADDDEAIGESPVVVLELRLLADALRREPGGPQRHASSSTASR